MSLQQSPNLGMQRCISSAGRDKKRLTIFRRMIQGSDKKTPGLIWRLGGHWRLHFTPTCENEQRKGSDFLQAWPETPNLKQNPWTTSMGPLASVQIEFHAATSP
ncbi:hypothetical protein DES53_110133 [Roseimicrobium gellanilyticum]|uniref:Uncharacterized protein n=1 Tax=Roseimicrobium gellanilyticum TaxID=748857 RepID=A0A366HB28_9BACT|nr:hypothetical protein DES53_110133 [Roseimicrobium gellanilyticum]